MIETRGEWKIEETYDTTMYEILVLIKTSSFLCVFLLQPGKLCESSTMTQLY